MSWVAVAVVGGSVIAGGASVYGSKQAGKSAQRGADAATAESARQFDLVREDTAPLRALQSGAIDRLSQLYGFASDPQGGYFSEELYLQQNPDVAADPWASKNAQEHWERFGRFEGRQNPMIGGTPGRAGGAPDTGAFFESPDYQFNLGEGQKAIDRSLAARGRSLSGAGVKEGVRFASGMASSEYGNFVNRLLATAGLGTTGVTTSANAGMNTAAQIGAAQQNAGNARASAYMTGAQGVNNAVQGGISNWMLMRYLNTTPPTGGA